MLRKLHCVVLACLLLGAAGVDEQTAFRKLGTIEAGAAAPGSRFAFTPAEVNAWFRAEGRARVPQGVRDLRVDLGAERATGYATVDFLKIQKAATGQEPGWLMKNLFAGERPVVVTARFASRDGRARVDVERVEVSGIAIEGRTLEFVIEDYLRPTFPDVVVNEWFGLKFGVERFTVAPGGVSVSVGTTAKQIPK